MARVAVIYWSGSGNTEAMANAVADGARAAGAEVSLLEVSQTTATDAAQFDRLALGCPAMGAEVLEETIFEPFFTELEPRLSGKRVGLFGSYGWGDGQWMRDWCRRTDLAGAILCASEGLIANDAPNADDIAACEALGKELSA